MYLVTAWWTPSSIPYTRDLRLHMLPEKTSAPLIVVERAAPSDKLMIKDAIWTVRGSVEIHRSGCNIVCLPTRHAKQIMLKKGAVGFWGSFLILTIQNLSQNVKLSKRSVSFTHACRLEHSCSNYNYLLQPVSFIRVPSKHLLHWTAWLEKGL